VRHFLGRFLLMALVLAPAAAGCGSDDPAPAGTAAAPTTSAAVAASSPQPKPPATGSPSAAATTSATPKSLSTAKFNAFSACMRKHGVKVPPNATQSWTPGPGADKEKSQKAVLACLNNLISPS
jgi:hypothetical protein